MSDRNGYIELDGLELLMKEFEDCKPEMRKAARQAIEKTGLQIIAEAQRNLRRNRSVVTGVTRQSGHVQKNPDGMSADVGFFDTTNRNSGNALYLEYGRRAGKFPPIDELVQWAKKKFGLEDRDARTVGFLTARKIAMQGSTPHPFFHPAVEVKGKNFEENLKAILQRMKKYK